MSRVHDALRRAEQLLDAGADAAQPASDGGPDPNSLVVADAAQVSQQRPIEVPNYNGGAGIVRSADAKGLQVDWRNFLARCQVIPFRPAPETHLIDIERPHEVPGEEFRSLRTRLNHMQTQQDLHAIVITSASPAEGKTFTAINLALAQAQLEAPVLIADLDLRRPVIHNMLQCDKAPGFSDFLLAERPLEDCVRRIEGTNLYFMPAGTQVRNPLELLNMRQVKYTIDAFRKVFNWVILDTPPLLFSADANLLATLTDGTLIVVRIGSTTYDNVIRAMQTLCENNVLGIVANGARAGELYSKYTYYYTKNDSDDTTSPAEESEDEAAPTVVAGKLPQHAAEEHEE
ncbi:MAG TPA: CpsD/CapB family tyrosine-protein kinase [Bryobacteraceae bacterium]|nr:CpsD/CapB family tyrosine-protein kinase [Bryobacteraceae bacterium]